MDPESPGKLWRKKEGRGRGRGRWRWFSHWKVRRLSGKLEGAAEWRGRFCPAGRWAKGCPREKSENAGKARNEKGCWWRRLDETGTKRKTERKGKTVHPHTETETNECNNEAALSRHCCVSLPVELSPILFCPSYFNAIFFAHSLRYLLPRLYSSECSFLSRKREKDRWKTMDNEASS